MALVLLAALLLLRLWSARRFRVSIGRVMIVVAAAGVLLKAVLWLKERA